VGSSKTSGPRLVRVWSARDAFLACSGRSVASCPRRGGHAAAGASNSGCLRCVNRGLTNPTPSPDMRATPLRISGRAASPDAVTDSAPSVKPRAIATTGLT